MRPCSSYEYLKKPLFRGEKKNETATTRSHWLVLFLQKKDLFRGGGKSGTLRRDSHIFRPKEKHAMEGRKEMLIYRRYLALAPITYQLMAGGMSWTRAICFPCGQVKSRGIKSSLRRCRRGHSPRRWLAVQG